MFKAEDITALASMDEVKDHVGFLNNLLLSSTAIHSITMAAGFSNLSRCKKLEYNSEKGKGYKDYLNCSHHAKEFTKISNDANSTLTKVAFQIAQNDCSALFEKFLICSRNEDGIHGRCAFEFRELSTCIRTGLQRFGIIQNVGLPEAEWKAADHPMPPSLHYPSIDDLSTVALAAIQHPNFKRYSSVEEYKKDLKKFIAVYPAAENLDSLPAEETLALLNSFYEFTLGPNPAKNSKKEAVKETVTDVVEDAKETITDIVEDAKEFVEDKFEAIVHHSSSDEGENPSKE